VELRGCIAETLLDSAAVGAAGLNPPAVAALWQGFLSCQPGLRYTDILCLSHLVEWVRHNRLTSADLDREATPGGRRGADE